MTNEVKRICNTYSKAELTSYLVDTQGFNAADYSSWSKQAIVEDIEYQEGNFAALDCYLQ